MKENVLAESAQLLQLSMYRKERTMSFSARSSEAFAVARDFFMSECGCKLLCESTYDSHTAGIFQLP